MYMATAMQIVNGRIGTDKGGGMMTCTTYRGESVVDYVLLTNSDFNHVSSYCKETHSSLKKSIHTVIARQGSKI